MDNLDSKQMYHKLVIEASNESTEIWLGDDEGHFVQKGVSVLNTSLLPGNYIVQFGLGSDAYPIKLDNDKKITESQITNGSSCIRPVPNI